MEAFVIDEKNISPTVISLLEKSKHLSAATAYELLKNDGTVKHALDPVAVFLAYVAPVNDLQPDKDGNATINLAYEDKAKVQHARVTSYSPLVGSRIYQLLTYIFSIRDLGISWNNISSEFQVRRLFSWHLRCCFNTCGNRSVHSAVTPSVLTPVIS